MLNLDEPLRAGSPITVLILAAVLDYGVGDPWGWPHPVRLMGWVTQNYTHGALKAFKTPVLLRWAGVVLGIGLIGGSGLVGWMTVQASRIIHPVLGVGVESVLLASCFAGRSLRSAAEEVLAPLENGDLQTARRSLSRYVGRDTETLAEPEILRAVLETVTENAIDGVMAPLFYALVGLSFTSIGSVALALAYKAASTLDSMVGYREVPFSQIGWFSARTEDALTWLPCRLAVITLAVLSGQPRTVWRLCQRDAKVDPSPNAGWSECAYAAILGVQMGGINWYRGVAKRKPFLGDPLYPITPVRIKHALQLTQYSFLVWLVLGSALATLLNFLS